MRQKGEFGRRKAFINYCRWSYKHENQFRESFEALIKSAEEKWNTLSEEEKTKFKQDPEVDTVKDNELKILLQANHNQ